MPLISWRERSRVDLRKCNDSRHVFYVWTQLIIFKFVLKSLSWPCDWWKGVACIVLICF